MILQNQPVENIQRSGMDTQNYLEQLLFNSLPGIKVNDIVPYVGILDFSEEVQGSVKHFENSLIYLPDSIWPRIRIESLDGSEVWYDKETVSTNLTDFLNEYVAAIVFVSDLLGWNTEFSPNGDNYKGVCQSSFDELPEGVWKVANDAVFYGGFIYFRVRGKDVEWGESFTESSWQSDYNIIPAAYLNVNIADDPKNRVLYYGRFTLDYEGGNDFVGEVGFKFMGSEIFSVSFTGSNLYPVLFSSVNCLTTNDSSKVGRGDGLKVYFIGYKINYDSVPVVESAAPPVIVTPFAGTIAPLTLFYSHDNQNSEGQAVIGYKSVFASGTSKIGFKAPQIALDYKDTDASAMLLLSESLVGQLQINALDSFDEVGQSILKEIGGDVRPFEVIYDSSNVPQKLYGFIINADCKLQVKQYKSDGTVLLTNDFDCLKGTQLLIDYFMVGIHHFGVRPTLNGYVCPFEFYFPYVKP